MKNERRIPKKKARVKIMIICFCLFTIVFWSSIHSFLGWAALEDDMPEKILMHWVIIKEPNKAIEFDGRI